ncbi:MAG: HU family DNA-binding protein [Pseudonocardiaceae bacterium]
MNKAQLIDALAERLGDKKVAAAAVAGLVDVVVRTVNAGDRVTITGFGVFEKRARAERTARNPRTGQTVTVQQTDVPAFRPGTLFREVVSGSRTLPAVGASATASAGRPVAASTSQRATSPVSVNQPATATSRPVTRLTAATSAQVTTANTTKTGKAVKVGKAAKAAKVEPKIQPKSAAKAKTTAKAAPKAPSKAVPKGAAKKAGKKAAAKK